MSDKFCPCHPPPGRQRTCALHVYLLADESCECCCKELASDKSRGIYKKYEVKRLNDDAGKHDECRYFVLDPQHDDHALAALRAYAKSCGKDYPELSRDIRRWLLQFRDRWPDDWYEPLVDTGAADE